MLALVIGIAIGVYLGIGLMSLLAISARAQDAVETERSVDSVPATPCGEGKSSLGAFGESRGQRFVVTR